MLVFAPLLLILSLCAAFVVRSPPPIRDADAIVAPSVLCKGRHFGWQWDKCSVDGAIIWTSVAFGHVNMSGNPPPRTMGKHIQYSPFTREQPYIGSLDRNNEVQLPPMVFAIYMQSHASLSFVWRSRMRLFFDFEDYDADFEIALDTSGNPFACDCDYATTAHNGSLTLHTNTEYVMDNVLAHLLIEPEWYSAGIAADDCNLVNVDVILEPATASGPSAVSIGSVSWNARFAIAFNRNALPQPRDKSIGALRRAHSSLVSHKMCAATHFSGTSARGYDHGAKTFSFSFHSGTDKVSVVILSASVTHDRQQRAVVEFLAWFENNDECGRVVAHANCMSSPFSFANLSCSAHGSSAPATVDFHQYTLDGHARERVISCTFASSSFASSDSVVDVHLIDPFFAFHALVPMCSLAKNRPVHKIVACSQPIYNAGFLEARWPGVLQAWVLYHVTTPRTTQ
jgi:hypothetical protein